LVDVDYLGNHLDVRVDNVNVAVEVTKIDPNGSCLLLKTGGETFPLDIGSTVSFGYRQKAEVIPVSINRT
jgi:hypothetical protein